MVGKSIAAAGMLAAVVGGAVVARADDPSAGAAQSSGGLALSAARGSLIVDRVAQAGADKLTVANHSPSVLDVTVKARPWMQSASGVVSPNRRGTLAGVSISEETFQLARGATRELTVTLNSSPAYLYGAVEVIGLPTDTTSRKGVVAGYRLISSLRYRPATATSAITTGAVKIVGSGSNKALTISVRNTGNTLEPVTGTVKLRGALGTRNASVKGTRILPGKSIRLPLVTGSALKPGTYTATITLTQARKKTTVTKRVTVRR